MAVYFKFKSAKDFDSVSIEGHFISVENLKDKIVEQKKLGRGSDYDLMISNAQTNEEYTDEGFMVPKNTSVIVRRVPGRPSMPIVAEVRDERKSSLEAPPVNSGYKTLESTQKNPLQSSGPDGLDDFGIDLYAVPEMVQAPTPLDDEDSKIKAFVDSSANEWQRQTQEGFAGVKAYGNKGQGRGLLRGAYGSAGRGGFEKKNPPHGYVCHRCGVTGHYIQHCPTNGDPTYDMKKVKPPTGIPKTMLFANPDGSYALPSGEVAVLRPNEAAFDREVDGLPSSSRPNFDIPPELCCPLCKGVLKEAVLTSKCCFNSYCDKCIRTEIISKGTCVCGATNILADDLLPNRTLRDAINRFLESQASAATSSGNVGSRAQLPDMESAPYARPAVSVAVKEASSAMVESDGSGNNESLAGGKDAGPNQPSASANRGPKRSESGTRPGNDGEALHPTKQGMEVTEASPESQLTKDTAQEMVNSERQLKPDSDLRDLTLSEPIKGRKKTKGKRPRQVNMEYSEGMWNQGPNFNNSQIQAENCCMHCGSYEHPSWNCYMMNGPGPSHHPPPMHGRPFGPGFNPQMMGMMYPPMDERYMMPFPHNPGPYNGYGVPPYEFQFNGPMGPPHEPFGPPPHVGMMPYGPPPPMQRDYVDPNLMSREEFEARKAELRRREREERFGREHVKYPSTNLDVGSARLQGRVGPRHISPSERERGTSLDLPDVEVHSHRNGEHRRLAQTSMSRPREDWNEEEEAQASSDAEGSAHPDYHTGKGHERWTSRRDAEAEASSGEEVSQDGRYSRGESAYSTKQKGRGYTSKAIGRSGQEVLRSGHKRSASGYDSEDDGDSRRQSGSQVGPSSRYVASRSTVPDDQPSRKAEYNPKDISDTRQQGGDRAVISRERPRGSVFDRTNLPVKPRRTIGDEYDAGDDQEFRAKRRKGAEQQVVRGSEDSSRQNSGVVSRKSRVKQEY